MDDFNTKENINDFAAWLAASAAHDAYYKVHPNGGVLLKQDMGAMLLLYIVAGLDQDYIHANLQKLREAPFDINSSGHYFRTYIFVCDFTNNSADEFRTFLEQELNENIRAQLLTELILYDFNAGTFINIGGGRVQDKHLRKVLNNASSALQMHPDERKHFIEEKQTAYQERLRDIRPIRQKKRLLHPLVVLLLINICIFVLDIIFEKRMDYKPIEHFGIQYGSAVYDGEWWRLILSMFLHADFSHLLGNMLMLTYLSTILENFYSDLQYWTVYLVSGFAGSLLSLVCMDPSTRSLGASGAIMGLGGVLVYRMFFGKSARAFRYAGSFFIIAVMVIYNLVMGLFAENINNFAHFSGFATGFLLALLFEKTRKKT